MFFEIVLTKYILELLLITLSWYVVAKSRKARKTNAATAAFFHFATVNLVYQVADLFMTINRNEEILNGYGFGCFIYAFTLFAMAHASFLWLNYVEEELGPKMMYTKRRKNLWAVPILVFAVLCAASVWTGWLFTFDENGKYTVGSLFFLQYVFIFGYVAVAMARSVVNFFTVNDKRGTYRILLIIMFIDAAAAGLQLVFLQNFMPVALVLNVLICYMNLYSREVEREEKVYTEQLAEESARNEALYHMVDGYKWSYGISAGSEVVSAQYDDSAIIRTDTFNPENTMAWVDSLHPDDRERVLGEFMAAVRDSSGKTPYETVYRMLGKDGKYFWAKTTGRLIPHADGTAELYGMSINITDQMEEQERRLRAAEERRGLEENNARFFALEDNFISLYDVELESGKYASFERDEFYKRNISDNVVSLTEFFKDLRTNVDRVVYPDDREATFRVQKKDNIIKALSENDHIDHYYRVITENGPMWLKMRIVYKDADKKNIILGVFNAEEEMAQRQKDEAFREELAQTNARLFALEDNFESLYEVDMESGNYLSFVKGDFYENTIKDRLVSPTDYFEDLRANIDAVIYEEDRDGLCEALSRESIRRELAASEHFDYYYRLNTDEGPVWFKIRVVWKDAEKKKIIIGVFNAKDDVEAEQLKAARAAAEEANAAKTNFLFNMSHDIRTPMNAITGFTNMAIKNIDDRGKVLDCMDKIQKSGNMLLSLINSVLEVSRIESGHASLDEQPGDVYYSFANIETTMRELAETKDIDLSFEFSGIRDRYVLADFSRCMRVFVNIITNAVKYTPEGGSVKVRCEQLGRAENGIAKYKYTVSDNGIGMSEEFQKHVFDQFSREKSSTVSGIEGTGLGMSVVKSFVELMGGTVTCESTLGEGTTFTVILPFRLQEEKKFIDPVTGDVVRSGETADKRETVDFSGRKVLLVEDNELNRELASEILSDEGIIVEEAEDGDIAVNIMHDAGPEYYDFILMDIQMPKMDGYEATRRIRAMYPDSKLPIIALSANAFEEDRLASKEAGMNDHVAKPINVKELFAVLAKYL